MLNFYKLILDDLTLSILLSMVIGVSLWINPRIMLQDYLKTFKYSLRRKYHEKNSSRASLGFPF